MRYIERDPALAPAYLSAPETVEAVSALGEFLESGGVSANQGYLEVDAAQILRHGSDQLLQACMDQFHGKCAFTEMPIESPDASALHLFRPGQGARSERGRKSKDGHYWWLVNEWSNLYLATPEVSSLKGEVFPIDGFRQDGPGEPLDRSLLIDPCRDRPEWFLRFGDNGSVQPHHAVGSFFTNEAAAELAGYDQFLANFEYNAQRADRSIRLLGLDAAHVRTSRLQALAEISPTTVTETQIIRWVDDLDESTPHLGAIRQMLARRMLRLDQKPSMELIARLRPELGALAWCGGHIGATRKLLGDQAGEVLSVGTEIFAQPEATAAPAAAPDVRRNSILDKSFGAPAITIDGEGVEPPAVAAAVAESTQSEPGEASPPETTASGGLAPASLAPAIKRITIDNFKAIQHVDIEIPTGQRVLSEPNRYQRLYEHLSKHSGKGSVTEATKPVVQTRVLIGENGSGKSSILQAVALALASDQERAQVDEGDLKDFIRWDLTPEGPKPNPTRLAKVVVELLGATFTLTIKPDGDVVHEAVDNSGNAIDTTGRSPWFLMRAYSATRTLKGEDSSREPLSIQNLFDPRVPLVKPEDWLLSLDAGQFGTVAATLHHLFNESNSDGSSPVATPKMDRVPADQPTKIVVGNVELRHLSDGYRAVITLFCDIMAAAQALNPTDMRSAEGIVIIDEIGAHLHPRWRSRISSLIRREFARMQIIVSTHEPLCMRGFLGGEVVLVERSDDDGVQVTPIERNPTGLRVDQLLTSEFFGLYTTLDPEENDRLNLYYQLRAKLAADGKLEDWETDLLERVRPDETQQVFGFSYREQLTYEAIDAYLTERRTRITPEQERERRGTAFNEVDEIWRAFERTRGSNGS